MKKILITGATGFVGACLTRRLIKENNEIYIITRNTSDLWRLDDIKNSLHIHDLDLMDSQKIKELAKEIKVNYVYHFATYGGYHYQNDLDKTISTNVIGTWNLFKAFSDEGIDMFINTSSSSEYGEKLEPMMENMILEPSNMYGATKASATILCSAYAKTKKIPFITYRLFSPYGYFDSGTRLIPTVITSCLSKTKLNLAKKNSNRDFIFIEDVINAYLSAINLKSAFGEIYNIGSGIKYSVEQVTDIIMNILNSKIEVQWGNEFNRRYEPQMWVGNIEKAKNDLKWKPKNTLQDGLEYTIQWFQKNMKYYR